MVLVQHTETPHLLGDTLLAIICLQLIIFSILVISLLSNPGSREQYTIVLVFSIHNFRECATEIFSPVTVDYINRDSGIIDM